MVYIKRIQKVFCIVAMVGLWGILYPELIFHEDVFRITDEDVYAGEENDAREVLNQKNDGYKLIFDVNRKNIRLKSRLWEEWKGLFDGEK